MKSPVRLWRIYQRAQRVLDRLDAAKQDRERRRATPEDTSYASASWWSGTLDAMRELVLVLPVPEEVQAVMLRNWKTTLSGVAALLALASKVVMTGQFDWGVDGPAAIAAIGLIAAKDGNVTGGSK